MIASRICSQIKGNAILKLIPSIKKKKYNEEKNLMRKVGFNILKNLNKKKIFFYFYDTSLFFVIFLFTS